MEIGIAGRHSTVIDRIAQRTVLCEVRSVPVGLRCKRAEAQEIKRLLVQDDVGSQIRRCIEDGTVVDQYVIIRQPKKIDRWVKSYRRICDCNSGTGNIDLLSSRVRRRIDDVNRTSTLLDVGIESDRKVRLVVHPGGVIWRR